MSSVPGQVEHAESAEAESDGGHGVTPNRRKGRDDVDDSNESVPHGVPVLDERGHRDSTCVGTTTRGGPAEEGDGHRPVAPCREPAAELDLSVASTLHAVEHEHRRCIRVRTGDDHAFEV